MRRGCGFCGVLVQQDCGRNSRGLRDVVVGLIILRREGLVPSAYPAVRGRFQTKIIAYKSHKDSTPFDSDKPDGNFRNVFDLDKQPDSFWRDIPVFPSPASKFLDMF